MYNGTSNKWTKHFDFIIVDVICINVAFFLATLIYSGSGHMYNTSLYRNVTISLTLIHFCVAFFRNGYSGILRRGYLKEMKDVVYHNAIIMAVLFVYLFLIHQANNVSRIVILIFFVMDTILMYISHIAFKKFYAVRKNYDNAKENMLLVVSSDMAADTINKISNGPDKRFEIVGIALTDVMDIKESDIDEIEGIPVVADANSVYEYARANVINDVFIRVSGVNSFVVEGMAYGFLNMGIKVHINVEFLTHALPNAGFETINEVAVVTTSINQVSPVGAFAKRALDICAGLVGCLVTGILFIFVAPAIKIADPNGPIFFCQLRAGKNGKPFKFYKFRSMYSDAEERKKELTEQNKMDGLMFKMDADPRIIGSGKDGTKKGLGHFLRATSIDEFPNFYSILKGDMSLVGTRPPTMDEYEQYEAHHKSRLATKPGLTGMWQISGRSDMTDFEEIVKLDNEYIMNWSFGLDIKIILKTFLVVIARKGSV